MTWLVNIIESPSDIDLLRERQEGHALRSSLQLAGINSRVYLAVSARCFIGALKHIITEHASTPQKHPIIHISAHGAENGIQLTSGGIYPWEDLRKIFTEVNKGLNGKLLLCMSTCKGYTAKKMIGNGENAPHAFHTLVGPRSDVDWPDTLVAFITFYHHFITHNREPDAIVKAMNSAAGFEKTIFKVTTSKNETSLHKKRVLLERETQRLLDYIESQTPPDEEA